MQEFTVPRAYDSHLHLLGTGMALEGLQLQALKSEAAVAELRILPQHFRGDWLVGFGWNQHQWSSAMLPSKESLDQIFPSFPVAFARVDGHALWMNSEALKRLGYYNKTESQAPTPAGGTIIRDLNGFPTGVFVDMAKIAVDLLIPPFSRQQKQQFISSAISNFNRAGFTHIRDMSGFADQWELLIEMDEKKQLTAYIDQNFSCENVPDFLQVLEFAKNARQVKSPHLRVSGIKFYFDGALGSEGALLSQPYLDSTNYGLSLWKSSEVEFVLRETWKAGFEACVHVIGDQASHLIAQSAWNVYQSGQRGMLNVEHAELLRPETIDLLSRMKTRCHMQPCHWLSDKEWLNKRIGELSQYAFRWRDLEAAKIELYWGSDSPIEPSSLRRNLLALKDAEASGIPTVTSEPWSYHSHPDADWGSNCKSVFKGEHTEVWFDNQRLI